MCRFECGLEFQASSGHSGVWICELERYHPGFSRRYGEIRYGQVSVSVTSDNVTVSAPVTTPTTNLTTATTTTPSTTTTTTTEYVLEEWEEKRNLAIRRTAEEEEEYQQNFFVLKIVVRTTVILTLLCLAAAFGLLFLHNWRMWDQTVAGGAGGGPVTRVPGLRGAGDSDDDTDDELYQEIDPMLKRKLVATRRKSVAFSVCVVDRENMTFDLESKRVMLGLSTDRLASSTLPTLREDCESEKMGQSIPLIIPPDNDGDPRPGVRFNQARRMSVPAVCLTQLLPQIEQNKMFPSSETII